MPPPDCRLSYVAELSCSRRRIKDIRESRQTTILLHGSYIIGLPIRHRLLVRVSSRPIINPGAALRLRPVPLYSIKFIIIISLTLSLS